MRLSPLLLLATLLRPAVVFGQTSKYDGDSNWSQICEKSKTQPIEVPELSGPLKQSQLATCDETSLYYGLTAKPDYAAALQCGWYQRAHPQHTVGNMFYGPGVLTMLYANGLAVPRNYNLAIRFACEEDWAAPAEMALRIGHLEYLRDTSAPATNLNLCDDITSGLSMGTCTSIQTRRADNERDAMIADIAATLSPVARSIFPRLQSAESAFENARSGKEVDLSGTARAMFELEEDQKLSDQFLINLKRFARSDIPPTSASDLATLDRQLNDVYQQIQQAPPSAWQDGTIQPDGIRDTERTWLALVDAWLGFARAAYPNISATSIRAQLIRLRLHQLRSLAPAAN